MVGYLTEQGIGQAKIQWGAEKNEKILDDPKVSEEVKRKILLIEDYKKFFYHYFDAKKTGIYTKTSLLDHDAVSYLVIASKHTKIEAHEFKFPFMGAFPYIGFFKKSSAESFAKKLREKENLVTYIRPVYAYSTLGYLEDRILSSFFHYNDVELAELIFHELFHTVFFVKDEVELNENLANYYGKELVAEYFKGSDGLNGHIQLEGKRKLLSQKIVELIALLQDEFKKLGGFITDEEADILTNRFVTEVFNPEVANYCEKIKLQDGECNFGNRWNQASFAAFLTYEEKQDFISDLRKMKDQNLKEFLGWLKDQEKEFKKEKNKDLSFADFLKKKVPHAPLATN